MTVFRAIIGLGNPGDQYRNTRHNCGFRFVDALATDHGVQFKLIPRLKVKATRVRIAGLLVWLVQPITYMNRSGAAYRQFTQYYKILPENTIVAHDDLDLPVGTVKLKSSGGHGGHNGLRDIIASTGNNNFLRVRIGIGRPNSKQAVVPYVLSVPRIEDQHCIDDSIDAALQVVPELLAGNLQLAMTTLHSRNRLVQGETAVPTES